MQRREAGFTFIEILVVMGIIVVLMGMVAVIVPRALEASRQTQSLNNVRNMAQMMAERSIQRRWPSYDGKNFVLSLVGIGLIDKRNPDNLVVLFSPGDSLFSLEKATPERYDEVTLQALKSGTDFHELTSYAGRRNLDRDYLITPNRQKIVIPIICDDDEGAVHHPDGLVIAYSDGKAKFVEWPDIKGMQAPDDPDNPEPFLGDNATAELLRGMSSE